MSRQEEEASGEGGMCRGVSSLLICARTFFCKVISSFIESVSAWYISSECVPAQTSYQQVSFGMVPDVVALAMFLTGSKKCWKRLLLKTVVRPL